MERSGHPRGASVAMQTVYELSTDWYAGRMERDWNPPTAARAEAVFRAHGLVGEFWRLT